MQAKEKMSLQAVAEMAHDHALLQRFAACAAAYPHVYEDAGHPVAWANNHAWQLAASPGWADAYTTDSGITDDMIRDAVCGILAPHPEPDPEPEPETSPAK